MAELPSIQAEHKAYLQAKIKEGRLQNNLRASSVGWACDRKHYYDLTLPHKAHDIGLQAIFDEGTVHEKDVEKKLREMGFEVDSMQEEFRFEKPLITAHIDGKLRKGDGPKYPFDSKSINAWGFDAINSAEDLIHSKHVWHRQYPIQILLYMLLTNAEYGCLIFKNKQNGMLKDVWFSFNEHIGWLDEAIKRAERVYANVEAKQPGERTQDLELCQACPWKADCLPNILREGQGVTFIESPELEELLEGREAVKEARKTYEELDKRIKKVLNELPQGEKVCGKFLIKIAERERKAYTVDAGTYKVITAVRTE